MDRKTNSRAWAGKADSASCLNNSVNNRASMSEKIIILFIIL